jgi:hypothetical protein
VKPPNEHFCLSGDRMFSRRRQCIYPPHCSIIQTATVLGCKPTKLDSDHENRTRCFESGLVYYICCFLITNPILPHVQHTRLPVSRSVLPTCLVGRKGSRRTAARIHASVGDPSDVSPTAFLPFSHVSFLMSSG